MEQISRFGAYGVLLRDSAILLTQKKSGPYRGLWGLPGGSIEFGETPEETLKRELLEESSLAIDKVELSHIATAAGQYKANGEPYGFHQVGLIYRVGAWAERADLVPQEKNRWVSLSQMEKEELTPFAKEAILQLPVNQRWRPQHRIRGKAIGLAVQKNRLLVCEVRDDEGALKGWCPLGGGIEFGETAEAALKREIREELDCGIQIEGDPLVLENLFEHHGVQGHEIVFAFPIHLDCREIYAKNRFQIAEDRGAIHWVEWIEIDRFKKGECTLFPPALVEKIDFFLQFLG